MIANYHTHTWRCKHATGTEREYVERAIEGGLKILGFADHTPMPYRGGYVSGAKMDMDQLPDYVDTILALKYEYRNDIEIHLGLEVEYYPLYFEELLSYVREFPIEYFIMGQHFLENEQGYPYAGNLTRREDWLLRYCEQSLEGLKTGYFSYFAHPDLIHFVENDALYREQMRRLCVEVKKLDIPLEINFLGISDNRHYPNPAFWEIAGEVGNTVVFGADAHEAKAVWNPEALSRAQDMVSRYGLKLLDTVPLKSLSARPS